MGKTEEKVLERNLEQKAFEDAAKAIKVIKEDGNLTNIELVENMVKDYKGWNIPGVSYWMPFNDPTL